MANIITAILPKLLAQGLMALRANTIMPRLVNRGYDTLAASRGDTINIPIPSAITAQDVTPSATPPSTADIAPTSVAIVLNKWKEAPFYLTDKDMMDTMEGTIPMQASEAIKSITQVMDLDTIAAFNGVYGFVGTPGTPPFSVPVSPNIVPDTSVYTQARAVLNRQLAPMGDRRVVLDPDAEGYALNLRAFQDSSWAGSQQGIVLGQIGTKMGADWFMDQNISVRATGTLTNGTIHAAKVNGAVLAGATSMNINEATLTGTILPGDVFSVATTLTAAANAIAGVTFTPAAPVGCFLTTAVVTFKGPVGGAGYVRNLLFHRDAVAFASRPLADLPLADSLVQSIGDPLTGVNIRLEITREHKRTRFSYDVLYGVQCVRPELAVVIAG
jgi:hypothetical protein